jgi:hypothetical protein
VTRSCLAEWMFLELIRSADSVGGGLGERVRSKKTQSKNSTPRVRYSLSYHSSVPIILGNPPYSVLIANAGQWERT